ncbi:MAG: sulfate transporter [Curvibacter sp. GWA2_64_110]|nr:MAG: sulfate transporter [Curvibacter sp. GWA2_64_110]HCY15605.1 sulfate transporter [Curvibacter sp.]
MNEEKQTVPPGYWQDANGSLVPVSKVKDIDKLRHKCVSELAEAAKKTSAQLLGFKLSAMQAVQEFVEKSLAQYDVAHGGKKGNITLVSFDGRYKIVRAMQDAIVFDERLQAAKALIDECVKTWSKGSNDNIKVLINDAFQVDKKGSVNTARILNLRTLKIDDEKWQRAMQAIGDSMKVASTKPYIRFYERDERSGEYVPIPLDVAAL